MIGIWALGAYLAVILLWTTLIKRSVGEAMILGFLVVLPFTGAAAAQSDGRHCTRPSPTKSSTPPWRSSSWDTCWTKPECWTG